ncbi:ABC transporter substrate-binding protein [Blastococcus deserti]|uniref:ABC transporter substrate-binding protein n=1 Tax=Blastococcus deserti TaxID=2259033 RepID=A0ABW4XCN6_9ACTN
MSSRRINGRFRDSSIRRGLAAGLVAALLTACGGGEAGSGGTDGEAPVPMTFTGAGNLSWLNIYVAHDEGIFERHGIESNVRLFDVGFLGTEAVLAGEAHTAGSVEFPLLGLLAQGGDIVVPAVVVQANDQRIVVDDSIQKPEDLAGKRIGLIAGSAFEYAFQEYLELHGVSRDEVEFVNVDAAEQVAVMARGDIDGFLNVEPVVSRGLESLGGDAHILEPGIEDVYQTRILLEMQGEWVRENPEATERVLEALIEADEFIEANPERAVEIGAEWTQQEPEVVRAFLDDAEFDYTVHLDQAARDSMQAIAEWMVDQGKIDRVPDLDEVFVPEYLEAVAPEQAE